MEINQMETNQNVISTTDENIDEYVDEQIDEYVDEQIDEQLDEQMDEMQEYQLEEGYFLSFRTPTETEKFILNMCVLLQPPVFLCLCEFARDRVFEFAISPQLIILLLFSVANFYLNCKLFYAFLETYWLDNKTIRAESGSCLLLFHIGRITRRKQRIFNFLIGIPWGIIHAIHFKNSLEQFASETVAYAFYLCVFIDIFLLALLFADLRNYSLIIQSRIYRNKEYAEEENTTIFPPEFFPTCISVLFPIGSWSLMHYLKREV